MRQELGHIVSAGKGKETDSPPSLQCDPIVTLNLTQQDASQPSDPQNHKISMCVVLSHKVHGNLLH